MSTRTKTSNAWLRRHVNDAHVKRARAEGYRSRAAFKLIEIGDRDRLFRTGMTVIDLGAAPGGWSQVAAQRVGRAGRVIAVDLLEFEPIAGVTLIQGDLCAVNTAARIDAALAGGCADLVISDMSPNISGIAATDQARALALAETALEFAAKRLKPGGNFLVKAFQGADFGALVLAMRKRFARVVNRKPAASRGESSEVYLLGLGLVMQSGDTDTGGEYPLE